MSTIALAELPAGSKVAIHSIFALGSTRRDVMSQINRAIRFGLHIELTGHGVLTDTDEASTARLKSAMAPLISGKISRKTPIRKISSNEYVYIGEYVTNHHFEDGSRHTCHCGKTVGRPRVLNEQAERDIIDDVMSNNNIKATAESFGVSATTVRSTMSRYGYVRRSAMSSFQNQAA